VAAVLSSSVLRSACNLYPVYSVLSSLEAVSIQTGDSLGLSRDHDKPTTQNDSTSKP
jgi:hypothetical protein